MDDEADLDGDDEQNLRPGPSTTNRTTVAGAVVKSVKMSLTPAAIPPVDFLQLLKEFAVTVPLVGNPIQARRSTVVLRVPATMSSRNCSRCPLVVRE